MDYNKIALVDSFCPARTGDFEISVDADISAYIKNYFPLTAGSKTAKISGYSHFYTVERDQIGEINVN